MSAGPLYHGGAPGLRPGDLVAPGHQRQVHPGCVHCAAHAAGTSSALEPATERTDMVYLTPVRLYAQYYASLYGRGDLYRVEPVGDTLRSQEDSIETWTAPAARVVAVLERAVLLTWSQRRALARTWRAADAAAGRAPTYADLVLDRMLGVRA